MSAIEEFQKVATFLCGLIRCTQMTKAAWFSDEDHSLANSVDISLVTQPQWTCTSDMPGWTVVGAVFRI